MLPRNHLDRIQVTFEVVVQFEVDNLGDSCYPKRMADRSRKPKRPRDLNQRAASTVARATGEEPIPESESVEVPELTPEERHSAAVALGRLGGKKGGPARAKKLTAEQRSESARKAARSRWAARS